ncbi:MAG: glycosyltransferase family 4 protein [Thiohalocapsa sp.]|jgi:glycosyltransferase involved in cell wall biosynthesis
MSAYQCGPGMGSVSQIGWEWYSRTAARVPVTLLTHVRNRKALEARGAPLAGSEIIYVDTEWFAGPLYRFAKKLFPNSEHAVFLLSSLDFYVYDSAALRLAKQRQKASTGAKADRIWDLVHCPTPVSPSAATVLHRLGLPTVLGPVNGGLRSPEHFPEFMRQDSSWLYPLRNLGRLVDAWRGSTRRAARVLVATESTRAWYARNRSVKCQFMLENAVDLSLFPVQPWPGAPDPARPLRVLFVGRLLPFKAVPLLLRAVRQSRDDGIAVEVTVVGDGPMREPWTREAGELGLADAVQFVGQQPLAAVSGYMADAHVFCLPSVRESGGAVLLEAMASARPVIAVDYGGPAEIVDDEVGRKVPATGNEAAIAGIRDALQDLSRDPDAWRRRGEAGRARVERQYSWDAKVDAAVELYRKLVAAAEAG